MYSAACASEPPKKRWRGEGALSNPLLLLTDRRSEGRLDRCAKKCCSRGRLAVPNADPEAHGAGPVGRGRAVLCASETYGGWPKAGKGSCKELVKDSKGHE